MNTRSSNNRGRVLDAARGIIEDRGTAHLTIDAVAARAGLSKGGVLYHFASKLKMLEALLAQALDESSSGYAQHRERKADNALAAWLRADTDATAASPSLAAAVFANAAEAPELLDPARAFIDGVLTDIGNDASDPDLAVLLLMAAEGMRMNEMFNLFALTAADRKRLRKRLLTLAETVGR